MRRKSILTRHLLSSTRMSPAERAMGRFMRSPDDHVDDAPPADQSLLDTVDDKPKEEPKVEDDKSLLDKVDDKPKEEGDKKDDPPKKEEPKKEDDKPKEEGPPEAYKFEDGTVDPVLVKEFEADWRERGLTQEQAAEEVARGQKLAEHWNNRAVEMFRETRQEWQTTIKADKEFGGEKLPATLAAAKQVLTTFGADDPSVKEVVDQFGLGDHPGFIKLMARVRGAISDDVFIKGGKGASDVRAEDRLYPSMRKKD